MVGAVSSSDVIFFSVSILIVFVLLFALFCFGWWLSRLTGSVSPYSGFPLRRASDISSESTMKTLKYLYRLYQYDNRLIDFNKAAVCRETGRIFPDCVTWYDVIKVDWSFLQKRYPGNWVSWGSLTSEQQEYIRAAHDGLSGFQTIYSSPNPSPRAIEPLYVYEKPGPLYVDLETKILLGWKCVPDTGLEVLIVQKPKKTLRISTISTND